MKNKLKVISMVLALLFGNNGVNSENFSKNSKNTNSFSSSLNEYKKKLFRKMSNKELKIIGCATLAVVLGAVVICKIAKKNNIDIDVSKKLILEKKLDNGVTLRIYHNGDASSGILISNTDSDPFVVRDENYNKLKTAIVSPNNQSFIDGTLGGEIEKIGGSLVINQKKDWREQVKNAPYGYDDHNNGKPIVISYGNARWGVSGNLKDLSGIIHAVGPKISNGKTSKGEKNTLKNTYINSFNLCVSNCVERCVCPPISMGVFGFDISLGCEYAIESAIEFSKSDEAKKGILKYIDLTMLDSDKEIIKNYVSASKDIFDV